MREKCRFQPLRHSRRSTWCFTFFFLKCKVTPRSWHDKSTRLIHCHSRYSLHTSCCRCIWVYVFACCAKLSGAFGLHEMDYSCGFWCLSLNLWPIPGWYLSWVSTRAISIFCKCRYLPFQESIFFHHLRQKWIENTPFVACFQELLFLCKQTPEMWQILPFLFNLTRFLWKPCLRKQLTDWSNSIICVTSKQNKESNKEQSLIQTGRWKHWCRWSFFVWFHLWCWWCPDERVWHSVRTSLLPLCVPQSPFCPLDDLWRSRLLQAFRNRGGIFFSGPLNMSEGACQEIIAGPKTVQVMNIRQPGGVELALFYKPQVLQLLLALQIWKKDITSPQSGGLLKR